MEGGGAAAEGKPKDPAAASYTYWVREKTSDAAPLPVPRKLNPDYQPNNENPARLGSAWNSAGTWEEKSLDKWADNRIKELLESMGSLEMCGGNAEITEVTKCSGDAFLVTVRNRKRVGYTYELTLGVKGEWLVGAERKVVKGHIDVQEFSFGELDRLQIKVRLNEDKDLEHKDKQQIRHNFEQFLQPLREKLLQFEQELKQKN
ncbi:unnamed protein product [Cuscuta epithymum]|uniref:Activator of Hsp90 ATPase AHSA1-like N-terminal domain-containing protein n=1 Tax=Cuscuta epithymum TaxID=186058 RepID=A0AAV0CGS2_9ASTE|nr:unnamed protein product [Cuscuta epithymum]